MDVPTLNLTDEEKKRGARLYKELGTALQSAVSEFFNKNQPNTEAENVLMINIIGQQFCDCLVNLSKETGDPDAARTVFAKYLLTEGGTKKQN